MPDNLSNAKGSVSKTTRGYALPMRIMHWLMALMMIYVIVVGFLMGNDFKVGVHYDYHRATGFLLMLLVVVRFGLKLTTKPPIPLHVGVPGPRQWAARIVHSMLYLLLVIQPFLGWYATNAWGVAKIPFFFGMTLPRIVEKDRALGNYLLEIHHYVGFLITLLVVMHISAALFHHFVERDGLILRMLKS